MTGEKYMVDSWVEMGSSTLRGFQR
jgi:hypothetical protein